MINFQIAGILGFVVLILGGGWLYWLSSKHPGRDVGLVILDMLNRNRVTVAMVGVGLLTLGEAVMAASITPAEEKFQINPWGRFITHAGIGGVALAISVGFVNLLAEFLRSLWSKNFALMAALLFMVFVSGIAAFYLPYWNMMLIANGLNESREVSLYFDSWFMSRTEFMSRIIFARKPTDYDAWDALSYPMATTVMMFAVIMLLMAYEAGAHILDAAKKSISDKEDKSPKDKGAKKPDDDKKPGTDEPADTKPKGDAKKKSDTETAIQRLLEFYGLSGDELDKKMSAAKQVIAGLNSSNSAKDLAAVMQNISGLNSRVDNASSDDAKKALKQDIHRVFGLSAKNGGGGLGITLKSLK